MSETEQIARLLGMVVAGIIAGFVAADARRRGLSASSSLGWGAGVFLMLIVFLPLYLWQRKYGSKTPKTPIQSAGAPCPYCEYLNVGEPNYCAKCGRQMRSSTEIHR